LRKQNYTNGVLGTTTYETISYYDDGVYRIQIEQDGSEDRIDATLVAYNNETFPQGISFATSSVSSSSASQTIDWFLPANVAVVGTYTYTIQIGATADAGDAITASITYTHIDGTTTSVLSTSLVGVSGTNSGASQAFPTPTKDVVQITYSYSYNSVGPNANSLSGSVQLNNDFVNGYQTLSEVKTIEVSSECSNQDLYLTWKNYLGGHDYWKFTAEKEYGVDVSDVKETTNNINTEWPKSYGEFADTIKQDISRTSHNTILVRSQNLTLDQVQALKYIKTSPLVQIMTSKTDRRTVQVDSGSFVSYSESDKLYGIQFTITYTDEIASQSL